MTHAAKSAVRGQALSDYPPSQRRCVGADAVQVSIGREINRSGAISRCGDEMMRRRHTSSSRTMAKVVLGIIGGSGIYDLPGLTNAQSKVIESPWGKPSAPVLTGEIDGLPIAFLSRHDKGHRLSPSDINYRANIDVLKRAGVTDLVSLSACARSRWNCRPAPSC